MLDAAESFDPDGNYLEYNWIAPDGSVTQSSTITVVDQSPFEPVSYTHLTLPTTPYV